MDFTHPGVGEAVCAHLNCVDTAALACCSSGTRQALGWLAESKKARVLDDLAWDVAAFKRAKAAVPHVGRDRTFDPEEHKAFWVAHGGPTASPAPGQERQPTVTAADEWTSFPQHDCPNQARLCSLPYVSKAPECRGVVMDDINGYRRSSEAYRDLEDMYRGTTTLFTTTSLLMVQDDVWYTCKYSLSVDGTASKYRSPRPDIPISSSEESSSDDEPPLTSEEQAILASGRGNQWVRLAQQQPGREFRAREREARRERRRRRDKQLREAVSDPSRYTRFVEAELDTLFGL